MDPQPEVFWIPPDDNPWNVPVLDVRSVTLGMTATSSNPTCAMNAVSFGQDDGTSFIGQLPKDTSSIPCSLRYRRDRLLADGALFLPEVMEHKWAIYHHAGKLIFIRSWLREVMVVAEVTQHDDSIEVIQIRGRFLENDDAAFTSRTLDYLIRSHAMGLPFPVPLPKGVEGDLQKAAVWCFSLFGNLAQFATPNVLNEPPPKEPLRSHSLLHIAVARGDRTAAETQLIAGVPVDLPAADGLPPLQWALAREGTDMLEFLLSKGSSIEARSTQGATSLMTASQRDNPDRLRWLLAHGAEVNARDHRGFTALHRAAELGNKQIVELLLKAGADPNIRVENYTPLFFAEARGHSEIVALLRNSGAKES